MFNNINDNNRDILQSQYNTSNIVNLAAIRAGYGKSNSAKNPYVDKTEISSDAMKLFQREVDVKKFTQIVLDTKDDISYLEKMNELFNDGIVDPFEDSIIQKLAENPKLLNDLEK